MERLGKKRGCGPRITNGQRIAHSDLGLDKTASAGQFMIDEIDFLADRIDGNIADLA